MALSLAGLTVHAVACVVMNQFIGKCVCYNGDGIMLSFLSSGTFLHGQATATNLMTALVNIHKPLVLIAARSSQLGIHSGVRKQAIVLNAGQCLSFQ